MASPRTWSSACARSRRTVTAADRAGEGPPHADLGRRARARVEAPVRRRDQRRGHQALARRRRASGSPAAARRRRYKRASLEVVGGDVELGPDGVAAARLGDVGRPSGRSRLLRAAPGSAADRRGRRRAGAAAAPAADVARRRARQGRSAGQGREAAVGRARGRAPTSPCFRCPISTRCARASPRSRRPFGTRVPDGSKVDIGGLAVKLDVGGEPFAFGPGPVHDGASRRHRAPHVREREGARPPTPLVDRRRASARRRRRHRAPLRRSGLARAARREGRDEGPLRRRARARCPARGSSCSRPPAMRSPSTVRSRCDRSPSSSRASPPSRSAGSTSRSARAACSTTAGASASTTRSSTWARSTCARTARSRRRAITSASRSRSTSRLPRVRRSSTARRRASCRPCAPRA